MVIQLLGGNNLLWSINKLCNTDKHQMLIPMAAANLGTELVLSGKPLGTHKHTFRAIKTWQFLNDNVIIFIYPAGMSLDGEITAIRSISFQTPGFLAGQPIDSVLEQFINITEDIVNKFEE